MNQIGTLQITNIRYYSEEMPHPPPRSFSGQISAKHITFSKQSGNIIITVENSSKNAKR